MTAWGTTMYPAVTDPQPTPLASGYGLTSALLAYGTTLATVIDPQPTTLVSGYRLAFSTGGRPTVGQLWPRGAINRI